MHLESIFKYFEEILWHFVDKVSLARQQHKEQLKRWGLFDLEKKWRTFFYLNSMTLLCAKAYE